MNLHTVFTTAVAAEAAAKAALLSIEKAIGPRSGGLACQAFLDAESSHRAAMKSTACIAEMIVQRTWVDSPERVEAEEHLLSVSAD